jgi:PIN domain nuclease of toxin-antitoxin system
VRLLLDTHVLLWWLADDPRLSEAAAEAIGSADNDVLVSAGSVWEIEIKRAKGMLETPDDLLEAIEAAGFLLLPIAAQSATLVTSDATLPPYGVATLAAS